MKKSNKVIVTVIIVSLTLTSLPVASAAENAGSDLNDTQIVTTSQSTTCEEKLSTLEKKNSEKESERLSRTSTKKAEQDTKIVTKRSEVDAARTKHREAVSTKIAGKPEVQAIVTKFQAAVDAALKARRDGNEAALTTFRTTVTSLESTRKLAVDAAFATLQSTACVTQDKTRKQQAWTTYRDAVSVAGTSFRTGLKDALNTLTSARVANRDAYLKAVTAATTAKKDALAAL